MVGNLIGNLFNYISQYLFKNSCLNVYCVFVFFIYSMFNDVVLVVLKLLYDMNVIIIVVVLGDWYDIGQIESVVSYFYLNMILLIMYV